MSVIKNFCPNEGTKTEKGPSGAGGAAAGGAAGGSTAGGSTLKANPLYGRYGCENGCVPWSREGCNDCIFLWSAFYLLWVMLYEGNTTLFRILCDVLDIPTRSGNKCRPTCADGIDTSQFETIVKAFKRDDAPLFWELAMKFRDFLIPCGNAGIAWMHQLAMLLGKPSYVVSENKLRAVLDAVKRLHVVPNHMFNYTRDELSAKNAAAPVANNLVFQDWGTLSMHNLANIVATSYEVWNDRLGVYAMATALSEITRPLEHQEVTVETVVTVCYGLKEIVTAVETIIQQWLGCAQSIARVRPMCNRHAVLAPLDHFFLHMHLHAAEEADQGTPLIPVMEGAHGFVCVALRCVSQKIDGLYKLNIIVPFLSTNHDLWKRVYGDMVDLFGRSEKLFFQCGGSSATQSPSFDGSLKHITSVLACLAGGAKIMHREALRVRDECERVLMAKKRKAPEPESTSQAMANAEVADILASTRGAAFAGDYDACAEKEAAVAAAPSLAAYPSDCQDFVSPGSSPGSSPDEFVEATPEPLTPPPHTSMSDDDDDDDEI